ncbi:hypothetical protein GOV12_03565 [Candidatus Pacearchaeota archaeon]|nr:hypothetical protein [Candidatus Pacearchaeota archaeon]
MKIEEKDITRLLLSVDSGSINLTAATPSINPQRFKLPIDMSLVMTRLRELKFPDNYELSNGWDYGERLEMRTPVNKTMWEEFTTHFLKNYGGRVV